MKKNGLVSISEKNVIIWVFSLFSIVITLLFVLVPAPLEYRLIRTQEGKVVEITATSSQRFNRASALALVEFDSGNRVFVSFPTRRDVQKGTVISVDIFKAKGERYRYRLSPEDFE